MLPSEMQSSAARRKQLGAFYTPPAIAKQLVAWGLRQPSDTVLDPSFGELTFLEAAGERLSTLGAPSRTLGRQLYGVEVDDQAFRSAATKAWAGLDSAKLIHQDFLALRPGDPVPAVDVVLGNPPYLRYQGFNAQSGCFHGLAVEAASVSLTRLASSWASFLVHGVRFVAAGGRLGHVLPGELLHVQYARPVLEFLSREFRRVSVIAFEERVFPSAQAEVVLLCAEDRGSGPARIEFFSVAGLSDLNLEPLLRRPPKRKRCAGEERGKLLAELLPPATRRLYHEAEETEEIRPFRELAGVDIGTVTGANTFFLLPKEASIQFDPRLFVPAVSRAAHVPGTRFTKVDHRRLEEAGLRTQLLRVKENTPADALATVDSYVRTGEAAGLHLRTKCRERDPWWAIKPPREPVPDLFLTYCAHQHPRLVLNEARVTHTNTLHGVMASRTVRPRALALGFYNSLTMLSAELLARSYGGGVLKLEPTEAEALLMPPVDNLDGCRNLLLEVDRLIRANELDKALDIVDARVLRQGLGLDKTEVDLLRRGAQRLRTRRHSRRRGAGVVPVVAVASVSARPRTQRPH